jgi:hypothetical protein
MERVCIPTQPNMSLEYEASNEREFGPCPDCGQQTKRVWGYVYRDDAAIAAYFVEWTPSHQERDAMFDLIIGKWGDSAGAADRKAASVAYRVLETGPSFMVQDASTRRIGSSSLVSEALSRNDVVGKQVASEVFAICDLIYLADPRIASLRQ